MPKVMVFVDGSWLYSNMPKLSEAYGKPNFHVDYGLLPKSIASIIGSQHGMTDLDIVRTYLFGSYPENYDLGDEDSVQRRIEFFEMLKEEFHYEVEAFPINFRGRKVRKKDRDPDDDFEPKEKCVDIALATSMLYYSAIPHVYDIAIAIIGDRDYIPVLQTLRRMGKRVAIASIKDCCAIEYADPLDRARVKDFDLIWLNDILDRVELKFERRQLECQSPMHKGDRKVWTDFRPRKGRPFYCDSCRKSFIEQKEAAQKEFLAASSMNEDEGVDIFRGPLQGEVEKLIPERGFGFIKSEEGKRYFFHLTDLEDIEWERVDIGLEVFFHVKREPEGTKAGAAGKVRPSLP